MRRAALALLGTVAGLVALLSFKTHGTTVAAPAAVGTTDTNGATGAGTVPADSSPTGTPTTPAAGSSSSSSATGASGTRTVTGDSVDTRWGPVQVRITVTNGTITSATAVVFPQNNGRDMEINSVAIPTLQQESVGKTKASQVDTVSGATYTSDGYIQSLQSALDKL